MEKTFTAILGLAQRFDASPGPDGRIRTSVWDRFCTMGQKVKEGEESVFDTKTLGEMVANWYARGGRLAMCQDHKSAATPYVSAPALAFYDAMAIVEGGNVVLFQKLVDSPAAEPDVAGLRESVKRFATEENPEPSPDGLWGFRCEITPLGEDSKEGLRNYRGISPMFVTDGTNEQEQPVGYVLFDVAATNTAFQAGCEITFSRLGATAVRIRDKRGNLDAATASVGDRVQTTNGPVLDGVVVEIARDKFGAGLGGVKVRTPSGTDWYSPLDLCAMSERRAQAMANVNTCPRCWSDAIEATAGGRADKAWRCQSCGLRFDVPRLTTLSAMRRRRGTRPPAETMAVGPGLKIGDRLRVDQSHRDQHGVRLKSGATGTVKEVANENGYVSCRVQWDDGNESWVWVRHESPISSMHRVSMAGEVETVRAPKYKPGDTVWLPGEDNPLTIIERLGEADTGEMQGGKWVKDWLYRVRDAKGRESRLWLSRRFGRSAMAYQGDKEKCPHCGSMDTEIDASDPGGWEEDWRCNQCGGEFHVSHQSSNDRGTVTKKMSRRQILSALVACPLCEGSGSEKGDVGGRAIRCRACNGERQVTAQRAEQIRRDFNLGLPPTLHAAATRELRKCPECGKQVAVEGSRYAVHEVGEEGSGNCPESGKPIVRPPLGYSRARAQQAAPTYVRGGTRGALIRRYTLGQESWLLVKTATGVVSWPARDAQAA